MRAEAGAPLRGALIGFGQVAEAAHLPAYLGARGGFVIAAVAEESPARRDRARALLPGARVHASLSDLLEAEGGLDFVDIATPPFLHARQCREALGAGLHVLCEKPLTLDPAEARELGAEAARRGRALVAVHNWKHAPLLARVIALVDAGALGELRRVELSTVRMRPAASAAGDWRRDARLAGGGILADHGWHSLYLLHRLLGAPDLPRVSARVSRLPAEDKALLSLDFGSARARLYFSWRAGRRANLGRLEGTRASLRLLDDRLELEGPEPASTSFPERLSLGSAHPDWFRRFLDDFAAEVRDPARRGESLREAGFCAEVLARAYAQAARTARVAA